jgi:hypothetical protein
MDVFWDVRMIASCMQIAPKEDLVEVGWLLVLVLVLVSREPSKDNESSYGAIDTLPYSPSL